VNAALEIVASRPELPELLRADNVAAGLDLPGQCRECLGVEPAETFVAGGNVDFEPPEVVERLVVEPI
jgi:hypothetical protein